VKNHATPVSPRKPESVGAPECLPDTPSDPQRVAEQFLPGDVDDLEARLQQQPVPSALGDGPLAAVVLEQAVRLGSSTDSASPSAKSITCLARLVPGHRSQPASTRRNSLFDACRS
jgi:hypothetical protein